jgi:hypothetical protein
MTVRFGVPALLTLLASPRSSSAAEPLETETANTLNSGVLQAEVVSEYQTSADGTEFATPMALEYGVLNDLEFLVEPVFYTAITQPGLPTQRGVGDLETTAVFRFLHNNWTDGGFIPNVALAAELKAPTARNRFIGTGKFDYTGFLIVSEKLGPFDVHFNVGYSVLGSPPGTQLNNVWDFAAAVVFHATERVDLLTEVLATTSPLPGDGENPESSANPEISGDELVGMLGMRYFLEPKIGWVSLAATYDNNNAVLVRTAFSWRFPTY